MIREFRGMTQEWGADLVLWGRFVLGISIFRCCYAGLLGGAVYVNAFTLLAKEVEPSLREFSMSTASLADSVGIALADICGILVQARPRLDFPLISDMSASFWARDVNSPVSVCTVTMAAESA